MFRWGAGSEIAHAVTIDVYRILRGTMQPKCSDAQRLGYHVLVRLFITNTYNTLHWVHHVMCVHSSNAPTGQEGVKLSCDVTCTICHIGPLF